MIWRSTEITMFMGFKVLQINGCMFFNLVIQLYFFKLFFFLRESNLWDRNTSVVATAKNFIP